MSDNSVVPQPLLNIVTTVATPGALTGGKIGTFKSAAVVDAGHAVGKLLNLYGILSGNLWTHARYVTPWTAGP